MNIVKFCLACYPPTYLTPHCPGQRDMWSEQGNNDAEVLILKEERAQHFKYMLNMW